MGVHSGIVVVALFVAGMSVCYADKPIDAASYRSLSKEEAAKVLLNEAMVQADGGSIARRPCVAGLPVIFGMD